jgi:hypothetical protein
VALATAAERFYYEKDWWVLHVQGSAPLPYYTHIRSQTFEKLRKRLCSMMLPNVPHTHHAPFSSFNCHHYSWQKDESEPCGTSSSHRSVHLCYQLPPFAKRLEAGGGCGMVLLVHSG